MEVEEGPPVVKATSDKRNYKLIKLRNGLGVLLISDPDVADVPESSDEDEDGGEPEDMMDLEWEGPARCADEGDPSFSCSGTQLQSHRTGLYGEDFMSEVKLRLPYHPDEEGVPNRALLYNRLKQDKQLNRWKQNRLKQDKQDEESAQDQSHKNAAAAMCVGVGSMVDPPEAPGLAHFLEHMLFMGSTKFPDENEYDKFLSQHGGSSNAYTDQEFTCFHFEVRNQSFRGALERFSQFFISPLVKVEAMDREIQAIESEFVQAAGNDMNRLAQVQCHTAFPSHPLHRFAWGNRKSLQNDPARQGIDMRAKLLQLFHDHYLAGRMKLVVLGGGGWVIGNLAKVGGGAFW